MLQMGHTSTGKPIEAFCACQLGRLKAEQYNRDWRSKPRPLEKEKKR